VAPLIALSHSRANSIAPFPASGHIATARPACHSRSETVLIKAFAREGLSKGAKEVAALAKALE
jgi:hypothetical protein